MSKPTYKVTFELKDGSSISGSYYNDMNWIRWIEDVNIAEILFIDDRGKEVSIKIDNTDRIIIDHQQFKLIKYLRLNKTDVNPKDEQTTLTTLELINKINSIMNEHNLTVEEISQAVNMLRMIKNKDFNKFDSVLETEKQHLLE